MGLALCAFVIYLSLRSEPAGLGGVHGTRLDHMFAYVVLMLWHAQLYRTLRARVACALAFVAMGVALEFLQLLTGSRTFSVVDMLANAAGVGVGWLGAPPRSPNFLLAVEARLP